VKTSIFAHVISVEARKLMSYRFDFWINSLLGTLAQFALVYFLWSAIMGDSTDLKAGYSFDGIVFYYVLMILLGKLVGTSYNQGDVASDIYEGSLSRYLLFPTSYFAFKFAQRLGSLTPALVQLAVLGLTYLLILPFPEEVQVSPSSVLMGTISLFVACLLFYLLSWLLQLVAFWADNVWSLVVMMLFVGRLLGGALIPLSMFPEWSQNYLSLLPFRYVYGFPVETIMGRVEPSAWIQGVGISLVWIAITSTLSHLVWKRGMLVYSGVGI
jgi:ABC-2 type transport system permease protein